MPKLLKKSLPIICLAIAVFALAQLALAAEADLGIQYGQGIGLSQEDPRVIAANIIRIALGFLGIIAIGLMIYAGWLWMTAGGEADKIDKAKKILVSALIGLLIIVSAFAIASFVLQKLLNSTGDDNGNDRSDDRDDDLNNGSLSTSFYPRGKWSVPLNAIGQVKFSSPVDVSSGAFKVSAAANFSDAGVELLNNNLEISQDNDVIIFNNSLTCQAVKDKYPDAKITIPTGHELDKCFEPDLIDIATDRNSFNTGYRVEASGYNKLADNTVALTCPVGGCIAYFSARPTLDVTPPVISFNPRTFCVNTNNTINALITDDWGLRDIGVYIDKVLTPATTTLSAALKSYPSETTSDTITATGDHVIKILAVDVANNLAVLERTIEAWPDHCCNKIQDGGEAQVDCGNSCPACLGQPCDADTNTPACDIGECANDLLCSVKDNCTCIATPLIDWISPVDAEKNPNGAPGNFITIGGIYFGDTPGRVIFGGQDADNNGQIFGDTDDETASLPDTVNQQCKNNWQDKQIIAVVPEAAVSGPIKVVNTKNTADAADDLYDTTDNERGNPINDFQINDLRRPGLCLANPDNGYFNDQFALQGNTFVGTSKQVLFGDNSTNIAAKDVSDWTTNSVNAKVPDVKTGRNTVFVKIDNVGSNYLNFQVKGLNPSGPQIDYLDPEQGPVGQYVTIYGRNFKRQAGEVNFYSASDPNTAIKADIVCGNNWWHDSYIVVKVPQVAELGNNKIKVRDKDGNQSPAADFKIVSGQPAPGLCELKPPNGNVGDQINASGEYFGAQGTGSKAQFYNRKDGAVTSWTDRSLTASVPTGAVTGPFKVIRNNDDKVSNSLPFTVGSCTDNNQCNNGEVCCANGSAREGICSAPDQCNAVPPSTCAFGWSFSTGGSVCASDLVQCNIPGGNSYNCCANQSQCNLTTGQCDSCPASQPDQCGNGQCCAANRCQDTNSDGKSECLDDLCAQDQAQCDIPQNPGQYNCCANQSQCNLTTGQCDSCPASQPDQCGNGQCCAAGQCRDTNGDGQTECAAASSCSGYSLSQNQCSDNILCPNSPGQCSANQGGRTLVTGNCDNSCNDQSVCKTDQCQYNVSLNKCVAKQTSCALPASVKISNKDFRETCIKYENTGRWQITTNQSCPDGWTNIGGGKCVNLATECELCPGGFSCLDDKSGDNTGICVVDKTVCPSGSVCGQDNKCAKTEAANCQCCCRIEKSAQDCCALTQCTGTCGADATDDGQGFGQCTGCAAAGDTKEERDAACNCTGRSGKICDTSEKAEGVCRDIRDPNECTASSANCCVDAQNKNADGSFRFQLRPGDKSLVTSDDGTAQDYAYCPYYECLTAADNSKSCNNQAVASSNNPVYTTSAICNTSCKSGGGQLCGKLNNNICSDADNSKCDQGLICDTTTCRCKPDGGGPGDMCKIASVSACANNSGSCSDVGHTCLSKDVADCRCCCNPNDKTVSPDKIVNGKTLTCTSDKTPCDGDNRGLYCGCEKDNDCSVIGSVDGIGCSTDACCRARPVVALVSPQGDGVCRNVLIKADFSQLMDINSFKDQAVVLGDYGMEQCPAGTKYLTLDKAPSKTLLGKIKNTLIWLIAKVPLVDKLIFGGRAYALANNFCAVPGIINGYNSGDKGTLTFSPAKPLEKNKTYYVIIKEDNINDNIKQGVLSYYGVSVKATEVDDAQKAYNFNGVGYKGRIWSFTTGDDICKLQAVSIDPASYVFTSSENKTEDDVYITQDLSAQDTAKDLTVKDSDKIYRAQALTAGNQEIARLDGVYSWQWQWSIDNEALVKFTTDKVFDSNAILVAQNVKDGKTYVNAKAVITADTVSKPSTVNQTIAGKARVYVIMCANLWPPVTDTNWAPWVDNSDNCNPDLSSGKCVGGDNSGNACGNSTECPGGQCNSCLDNNFELYYCRDAGGPGTADDLPVIYTGLNQGSNVIMGTALKCVGGGKNDETCYNDKDCPDGLCSGGFLKEFYFLREDAPPGLPLRTEDSSGFSASALPEGGQAELSWNKIDSASGYKIYYDTVSGRHGTMIEIKNNDILNKIVAGLTNGKTYYFSITSYNSKGAESDYSPEIAVVPADTEKPAQPQAFASIAKDGRIDLSWTANTDDTALYRVYYGASADYGDSLAVNKNICAQVSCAASINNLTNGIKYYLGLIAIDAYNNRSATSTAENIPVKQ